MFLGDIWLVFIILTARHEMTKHFFLVCNTNNFFLNVCLLFPRPFSLYFTCRKSGGVGGMGGSEGVSLIVTARLIFSK